jgi:hypothetical protein
MLWCSCAQGALTAVAVAAAVAAAAAAAAAAVMLGVIKQVGSSACGVQGTFKLTAA